MRAFVACAFLVVFPPGSIAQDDVLVYGEIMDHRTRTPLADAFVVIASERGVRDTLRADAEGAYETHLPYGRLWQLRYEAPGRVSKLIAIDTRGIPPEEMEGGHGMHIGMKLFEAEEGRDYSALKDPMGIARYVDSTAMIEWDMALVERMRARIAPLLPDSTATTIPALTKKPQQADVGVDPLKLVLGGLLAAIILFFGIRLLVVRSRN